MIYRLLTLLSAALLAAPVAGCCRSGPDVVQHLLTIGQSSQAFHATAGRQPRSVEEVAEGARRAGVRFDPAEFSRFTFDPAPDGGTVLQFTQKGFCGWTAKVRMPSAPPAETRPAADIETPSVTETP